VFRRFIVAILLTVGLAAQEAEPQAEPVSRVAKAIADYQSVAKDPAKASQRRHAIVWIGEIDDPAATAFLQDELAAAGDTGFAFTVIEAIAKVARPSLQPQLRAVLERTSAPLAARVAAAGAIVRLGDRAMDSMLEMAAAPEASISQAQRDAAISALVDSGSDRALRGLVPLLLDGPWPQRLRLLRRLENVHGLAPLDAARIRLAQEGELETAAVAWRQLTVGKHERAKTLAVDVLERIVGDPRPAIAAELIGGLVRVHDEELYPVLLRYGSLPAEVVKKALRSAASVVAQDPALVKWLVTKGLEDINPGPRDAAKLLLTEAPAEALRPLLDRIRTDIRAGKKKALDLAVGLHELLAKDPSWHSELAALAATNDVEHRLLGLSMLLEIGSDAGLVTAQQSLGHKAWEVRSLALRYLTKCRDVASIPLLIARYGKEDGRLGAELDQALFVHTGKRCISRREWEAWWEKNKTGFVLPPPDTIVAATASPTSNAPGAGNTIAYHDIPVVSNRIAFLVDRSGSMAERIGTDKKRSRLDAAKEQLVKVVEALPATHLVNLIAFETKVDALWPELRPLNEDNRGKLLKIARDLPLGRGTNIFDALELAFADPKVDTIYLLTDGDPSVGRVVSPEGILEEVRRWNRTRQIVVHCIGLGIDSDLLKRLAAATGGAYRCVK
jgi:hypothetical protein